MSAVSITAANVVPGSDAVTEDIIAGATITAGQVYYKDTAASNVAKLTDADSATTAARVADGIALNGAAAGQPMRGQVGGSLTIGGTVAVGTIYVAGATAGAINPSSDLAQNWQTNVLGVATTTGVIQMGKGILKSGVQVP